METKLKEIPIVKCENCGTLIRSDDAKIYSHHRSGAKLLDIDPEEMPGCAMLLCSSCAEKFEKDKSDGHAGYWWGC